MRYRIIGISHTISHCDIVCDSKIIAYDILVRYRMRYKRYRIIGISHAISQCDIVCDSKCIAHDIAHDIALGYRMRYKRYRIIGISHAISQCDIVCDIIGYRIRYKRYRKCDKKDIAWDIAEISQWCDIACDIAFVKNPDVCYIAWYIPPLLYSTLPFAI